MCDNCVAIPNTNQLDTDSDGDGDVCDSDEDDDSISSNSDNCPLHANPGTTEKRDTSCFYLHATYI